MVCKVKHTDYQPNGEEWFCPKCENDDLYISGGKCDNEDCKELGVLHETDEVECDKCGFFDDGKTISEMLEAINKGKICHCCKGIGFVKD